MILFRGIFMEINEMILVCSPRFSVRPITQPQVPPPRPELVAIILVRRGIIIKHVYGVDNNKRRVECLLAWLCSAALPHLNNFCSTQVYKRNFTCQELVLAVSVHLLRLQECTS